MLTIGDVRENVVKALTCPEHIAQVVESLYAKGSVLSEKRKELLDKYGKQRKRKLPIESPVVAYDDDDDLSQMF